MSASSVERSSLRPLFPWDVEAIVEVRRSWEKAGILNMAMSGHFVMACLVRAQPCLFAADLSSCKRWVIEPHLVGFRWRDLAAQP